MGHVTRRVLLSIFLLAPVGLTASPAHPPAVVSLLPRGDPLALAPLRPPASHVVGLARASAIRLVQEQTRGADVREVEVTL